MVEGGAEFLHEDVIAEAIIWGHKQIQPLIDIQEELRAKLGKPKLEFPAPVVDEAFNAFVASVATGPLGDALAVPEKMARRSAKKEAKAKVVELVKERYPEDPTAAKRVSEVLGALEKSIVRTRIKETGRRIDGRDLTTVRKLECEVSLLPRTHGSALFARGETKVMAVATLGSTGDEQKIETLMGNTSKRFMLHYNFPPYSVGEVKMLRGPARREIGHGVLAERSISRVLPSPEEFPFTMRIVAQTLESNGSSSMASVCGASLALMDAGVPVKAHVAGIAMGLIKEGDEFFILTDILGDEDALGDMDFKVAGTAEGVTGVQMDIKVAGIPAEVLKRALAQAREARMHILEYMVTILPGPRKELSPYAPQLAVVEIHPDKIREVIGPGGKTIKAITAATGASIDIDDSGKISIFAPTMESLEKARAMVAHYDQRPDVGANYVGKVKKILDCGAVVEILPGLEGLVHVSQLDIERVENPADVVQLGQEVTVKVLDVEPNGRVRLSRKAWLMEQAGQEIDLTQFARTPGPRRDDRGPRRDDRGGRGGDRGGRR
jgi:polyribonucleotide nucleotidyltransferase